MRSLLQWRHRNPCGFPTVDDIQIRRLQPGDSLTELTALLHRAFGPMGRMGLPCDCVHQPVEETIRRVRRGTCFVAVRGSRIVGTMTLQTPRWRRECGWYQRSDVASLHQFAVDPCEQGRGCGSRLLGFAEQWVRRLGYAELALDTPAEASHLVLFYKAQGFKPVMELHKPGKPYRSAVLSKAVSRRSSSINPWHSPHRTLWCGSLVPH